MAEVLGMMRKREWRLCQGWWWPVHPKLVFDQMAVPVLEIMDTTSYVLLFTYRPQEWNTF
jgi:hypothetical protein